MFGHRLLPALALTASLVALAGCGSDDDDETTTGSASAGGGDPVAVLATTPVVADIVRNVGGPTVDVTQVLQPNSDPHEYEPRPRDVETAGGAQLLVTSGDNLDAWASQLADAAGGDATTVDAGAGRPVTLPGEDEGEEASKFDPHWWHDPANVAYAASKVRDALVQADPEQADAIRSSTDVYLTKLRALDAGIEQCLAGVPADERKLVTDHDAFGYFTEKYDVEVIGAIIPSQTTQAQPSVRDTQELVRTIEREGVKAVFPEESANPRLAQAISRETGARSDLTLFGDTLGPEGSAGATYLGMEQANADAMVRGFTGGEQGCSIPGI